MSKQVRYGDQVYIEISDLLPPPNTDTRLLCANGFLEETVFGVKTHDYRKADFRNCIFTIRPSLVDAKEDLHALHSLRTELAFLSLSKPNTLGEKCLTNEISFKEKQIEEGKGNLDALNRKILLEMDGQCVRYGSVILLEHVESGYYLCAESSYHPNNPTLYNMILKKEITPACYFKFFSYISTADRSEIDYESEMKLISTYLNTVVTMEEIKNNFDGIGLTVVEEQKEETEKPNFPADDIRRESILKSFTTAPLAIGTALESSDKNRIKLVEYCSREDLLTFAKKKTIKNGDYVRFQLDDFYLTVSSTIHRENFNLVEQKSEGYPYNFINSIFQIIRVNQDYDYPKGIEIQSNPKKNDDEEVGKFYLKHLMSGHYLPLPKNKMYKSEDANSENTDKAGRTPFFHLVNSHLNQKCSLTRNSRVALKAFQGNGPNGQYYIEADVEKYKVLQADMNTRYFIGFKNAEDKIKSNLKQVKKFINGNKAVGSHFRVTLVNDEERKKILELESYFKALKHFMRILTSHMKNNGKVTPLIFESELRKVLSFSEKLLSLLETHDKQTQILVREFKILDIMARFLSHFLLNQDIKCVMDQKTFETEEVIKLLEKFCAIILNTTKGNEINHTYISQYVRMFILCMLDPSPLFAYCSKNETKQLKDIIVILLHKVLGEKDLETFGQLVYYEGKLFAGLDAQNDYSVHLLKLIDHYFSNNAPNLQNTLKERFIQKYLGDPKRLTKIFPKILASETEQDFEMEFERESYETKMMISTAPPEVIEYLIWVFRVITSTAKMLSLKFWNLVINYYSQDLLAAMLNSPKVHPNLKNSILAVIRMVHSAYNKLPFEKLPSKIQILLSQSEMEPWLEAYNAKVEQAQGALISPEEYNVINENKTRSSGVTIRVDIHQLSLELLKEGINKIENHNLESLNFILQVIKDLLNEEDLSDEILCTVHHSLGMLIHNLVEEVSTQSKGVYYDACIKNIDKIFYLLLGVDKHVGRRAFQESILSLKDKILKGDIYTIKGGKVTITENALDEATENKETTNILNSISDEWKSKKKLYQLAGRSLDNTIYLEETLMTDLWKIVQSEEHEITNAIIDLIKEKTNFEVKVRKQIFECALIAEEKEVTNFDQLVSSLLTLNKIARRIRFKIEFESKEKEEVKVLEEIIQNLENIFLIIYDFEQHMEEEEQGLSTEEAKEIFLLRFHHSKIKAKSELPFKYKSECIKTFYQKILNILKAHEIIVPFIRYLFFNQVCFEETDGDKFKLGYRLAMVIMILFMHKNVANQTLMSRYRDFVTTFYSNEIEQCSVESVFMFTEMCLDNKRFLKLEEDYLFTVVAYTFVEFYNHFSPQAQTSFAANYIRSLPFIYSCRISNDMFDPATFMMDTFNNYLNSLNMDYPLSLIELLSQANEIQPEDSNKEDQVDGVDLKKMVHSHQKVLDMPLSYNILKELLESMKLFALTEAKERVLVLQNLFIVEKVLPFLKNDNIEFNYELKQLSLQALENIFFKNIYRNTNIFSDYDHFLSFISVLLIDVYGYLKYKLRTEEDEIFEVFKSSHFKLEDNEDYFKKYDKLLSHDLEDLVFLQYQSLVVFTDIWKKYIYYLLCDFMENILVHFKDFMLTTKEKGEQYNNMFEVWLKLVLTIRTVDKDPTYRSMLDDAIKSAVIHAEYAYKRDLVYTKFDNQIKRLKTYKDKRAQKNSALSTDIDNIISVWLGDKSEYKLIYTEVNLRNIVSTLGLNKPVIKRLIDTMLIPETPTKDTLLILKLLRKLIEVENKTEANENQPIYLWGDVSETEFNRIHSIQEELVDLGVVEAIFALLYQYQIDKVVVTEVLLLCIALLFGGNEVVQDVFYEQFKDDLDNEILTNFIQILEEVLELLRVKESKKTQDSYLKALQHIFTYLIDHQTSMSLKDGVAVIPEEVKEKLAESYKSEVINKNTNQSNEYNFLLIVFEFLQILCEGHYLNFQEFLRDQTLVNHSKSSNIPEFLIHSYHIYHKHINITNVETGIKILDLLIEIQQGESKANSEVLLQKTFINDLCNTLTGFSTNLDLLARGFDFDSGHSRFTAIKSKILTLLKDLVERSDPIHLQQIHHYISLDALVTTFKENIIAFHKKKGEYPQKDQLTADDMWDLNLSSAFTVYSILKYLSVDEPFNDFTPEIQQVFKQILENDQGMSSELANRYLHQFFKKYTGSVEIFEKRLNKLMRIYFPVSIIYSYIKQDTKMEFANKVDRSSPQAKIADFMDATTELIGQSFIEYNSRQRLFGLNFYNTYGWLRLLTNVVAVVVVVFDLLHLEYTEETVVYKSEGDIKIQYLLCILQCFLSFILLFLWVETRLGRALASKWDEFVRENVKERGQLPQDMVKKLEGKDNLTEEIGEAVLLLKGPYSEEWKKVESFMSKKLARYNFYFTFCCGSFLWHLAYFGICIISNLHPLAAALQLFDIVVRSDTVSRIALSVSKNINQFMWTFILLVVAVYVYSLLGLYFFHSRYEDGDIGDMCQDAFSCYLTNLNFGLRSGGGIADVIKKMQYNHEEKAMYFLHTFYDLSFFILILTILLDLIFGMIVDAFGDLRDEKTTNEEDMKNVCFICGLTRSEYERTSNFEVHISEDHNMWKYLAYLIYLQEKSKYFVTELTDIEDYVLDRFRKRDYIWIPIGRSLTLEQHFAKEQKEKKSEIDIVKEELLGAIAEIQDQTNELMIKMKESMSGNELNQIQHSFSHKSGILSSATKTLY